VQAHGGIDAAAAERCHTLELESRFVLTLDARGEVSVELVSHPGRCAMPHIYALLLERGVSKVR
jgi:hypothetical protein